MAAIAALVVFGLMSTPVLRAQSRELAEDQPKFEVASIKPNKVGSGPGIVRIGWSSPDEFIAPNITLRRLIQIAYGVQDFQVSGGPSWIDGDKYDVDAKVDDSEAGKLQKLNLDQRALENRRILQALLADRFKLTVHHETKDLPVFILAVAKNGPKLKQAHPGDNYENGMKGADGVPVGANAMVREVGQLTGQGLPILSLARVLSSVLGRTVLDKTRLDGTYDFSLQWSPENLAASPGEADSTQSPLAVPSSSTSGTSIFTAIQDQLGLKLESAKSPGEVIVIDHVEQPSEN